MLTFEQLTLKDKPEIDRILAQLQPETSDLTFTNLFMWQHNYGLTVSYQPELDYYLLLAQPPDQRWKPFFLPPIGDWSDTNKLRRVVEIMNSLASGQGFPMRIRRSPQQLVDALLKLDQNWILKDERYTFDYLYLTTDLVNLAGRKYHGKRNHLNQFLRKYLSEYRRLTPELAERCLNLNSEWFNLNPATSDEQKAMAVVLKNFEALQLEGGVIIIEDEIQALTVGEKLNHNTAVIHIEKANTNYEGVYAAINQKFVSDCWSQMEYINREEDMGFEGLRKAKLSYYPVRLVEKFSITQQTV